MGSANSLQILPHCSVYESWRSVSDTNVSDDMCEGSSTIHTKPSFFITVPFAMSVFAKTPCCEALCPICKTSSNIFDMSLVPDML